MKKSRGKIFSKIQLKAVGTTFDDRQGKLWNIKKHEAAGEKPLTMLRREPANKYDSCAIAVLVQIGEVTAKVGYVPPDKAFWLSKKMDAGLIVRANNGHVIGGTDRAPHLGYQFEIAHQVADEDDVDVVPADEKND